MNNKEIQKIKVHIYQTIQEIKVREYEDHDKIDDLLKYIFDLILNTHYPSKNPMHDA